VKRRQFLAYLKDHGCELIREGAKHSWWGSTTTGRRSAVPRHTELSDLLCRKICRDLGIDDSVT
jgi:mRNA interferase HicA